MMSSDTDVEANLTTHQVADHRVILLGASNLTLAFPLLINSLRATLPGHLDILAADGHGRSFGAHSQVLGRGLPGIKNCGLWSTLEGLPASRNRPLALMTDIGNDLLYGADVEAIVGWLESSLQRLTAIGAQIVMTRLPTESADRLTSASFLVARTLMFPTSRITWEQVKTRVVELDLAVQALGARYGAAVVDLPGEWYGIDPIHIRRRLRWPAWKIILDHWSDLPEGMRLEDDSILGAWRMWTLRPAERWLLGWRQLKAQPSSVGIPQTTLWLY